MIALIKRWLKYHRADRIVADYGGHSYTFDDGDKDAAVQFMSAISKPNREVSCITRRDGTIMVNWRDRV